MRLLLALVPLALLAGCTSPSKHADDPLVAVTATPDSIYQHAAYDAPMLPSSALPFGDGRGGFVWLDGAVASEDRRGYEASETPRVPLEIDLSFVVRRALESAGVEAWETAARVAADSFATAQGGLHTGAVGQAVDRTLVAYGVHRGDAAGLRIASNALQRLAAAGSPDVSLALHAIGRLVGHADGRALEETGATIAASADAWLERPFRPILLSRHMQGRQMRQSEVQAMREVEMRINQPAVQERLELAQAAEALARP